MKDQFLMDLAPGWALAFDNLQWILARTPKQPPEGEKTVAGARLRPVAFIASSKRILWRCIHENGIQPIPEAVEYIDAMPGTFRVWYRRHRLQVVPVREAA